VLRELAEAGDPGENFGQVDLKALLEQLGEELTYVAETGVVVVRVTCPENLFVVGDRIKLSEVLGNAAAILIRSAIPGGVLNLSACHDDLTVHIASAWTGILGSKKKRAFRRSRRHSTRCSLLVCLGTWGRIQSYDERICLSTSSVRVNRLPQVGAR
jgi:hypothetical protein